MALVKHFILYVLAATSLLILFFFWWMGSSESFGNGTPGQLLGLGRLTGLLAVYAVLFQFLSMGRALWLERIFGLDRIANVHRINGYISLLLIIVHPIFIVYSYALVAQADIITQISRFIVFYHDLAQAAVAVLLFIGVVFLSIYIVRKKLKYETWYFTHLFTYLAVVLAFGHQLELGGTILSNQYFRMYWLFLYFFVFGNVLIFRFLRPAYYYLRHRFVITEVIQETSDTFSLLIGGKNLSNFLVNPGQFMIFRFLSKGFWTQAHPFSLSSLPYSDHFRITIKACGDFTKKLSNITPGTKVLIDGPYGIFTAPDKSSRRYLFIAGGVGITPIKTLLDQLAPSHDVVLFYNNKSSTDIIFKQELDLLSKQYHFPIHYIMSAEESYGGERGRVDKEKLLRLTPDFMDREIYVCGPVPMLLSLKEILCKELSFPKRKLHYEKFSF